NLTRHALAEIDERRGESENRRSGNGDCSSVMKGKIQKTDYAALLSDVKERVRNAQYAALKAVNRELVGLYWDIGKMIVERQAGKSWGKAVVENLARDLQAEFPGI